MKPRIYATFLPLSALLISCSAPPPTGTQVDQFIYDGPGGLRFTVTADGLSAIHLGDRPLAQGGWYAWDAGSSWFGRGPGQVLAYRSYSREAYGRIAKDLRAKTLEVIDRRHVRVRHEQPNVIATYDYEFQDEDVTIRARVENNHPDAELTIPAFGGLRFSFDQPPAGLLPVWHTSYLQATGLGAFHPSHLTKIGGSYAIDGAVGVGLSPVRSGWARTLFFWDYDAWNPDTPERVTNRWLTYLRAEPIPPGGALTFALTMRVSRNTDWRHLLVPYKKHFLATFGPVRYERDHRLVAVAHVNRNRESISPDNPYGFHGGFRRLDLAEGVKAFCDLLIPGLQQANGQGVILWGQGGQEPRGQMYRADFDVLPPEVEKNWNTLRERFAAAGLALGVTTRPRHLHVRLDWEQDGTIDLNERDPQHLAILWARFQTMIDKGCTLFYLDSFGNSLEDVITMRHLREKMGPKIHTFAEHQCDAVLPYSAIYTETDFWEQGSADWVKESGYYPRSGLQFLEITRWMLGDIPAITRVYDVHGKIPENFEPATRFFYRNGLTPMIEDYTLAGQAESLRQMQDGFLTPTGQWKNP